MDWVYMGRIYQCFLEEVEKQTLKQGIDVARKEGIFLHYTQKASLYCFVNERKCSSLFLVGILNHPVGSK